jgi:amino-acid N-acetyltransferase
VSPADAPLIRPALNHDLNGIRALLVRCELPTQDVDRHLPNFLVAVEDSCVIGTIGLEVLPGMGLLRSLAVTDEHRGRGVAGALYRALVERARAHGLLELWLLTTTAEAFFVRLGFEAAARREVPEMVQATEEFRSLCPATAVCMHRSIDPDPS